MSNRKLCLVIPSLQPGGMERVMSELATYFCGKPELEVHLILYGIKRDIFYSIPENIIIHKPQFEFDNAKRTWSTIRTIFFLRKQIKEIDPYKVLSFGELWNSFVLLSILGLKYPVFVSDRCQPDKSLGALHDRLRNWLYPKAKGVICQTEIAKNIYSKMFQHENFVVIGNPIRKIEANPEIPKENIVLTVGRLIKSKHHDELIKMFADINPKDWKLVIVGDDALKQRNKVKLEDLVRELDMQDKIQLLGKRSDVDDFYNRAKIFAFTSSSEGFPNVIGEAMSAGLPVIAYDCIAGPSDLVSHNNSGYLIDLHDRKNFKIALNRLINNEGDRTSLGNYGNEIIELYSVYSIGLKFHELLFKGEVQNG
jgi:glycosyltransferase involved in cell wall biosynthesis